MVSELKDKSKSDFALGRDAGCVFADVPTLRLFANELELSGRRYRNAASLVGKS
jgi:hypothetical protein